MSGPGGPRSKERRNSLWNSGNTTRPIVARLIRNGQASAREAVDSVLKRLSRQGQSGDQCGGARARGEEARAAAETADAARARGHALAAAARRAGHDQGQCRPGRPADRQRRGAAQGLHRHRGQPGGRQPQACRRHHRRPHQCAGLLDAHLLGQRPARPDATIRATGRVSRPAARAAAPALPRPPASAPSRMATTSAARCASRPIATAWSACAPASAASPRSIPARRVRSPAHRRRPDGGAGPAHPVGARRPPGPRGDGAGRSARLALERRAPAGPAAGAADQGGARAGECRAATRNPAFRPRR